MTAPAFTPRELQAMHLYCLQYRDLVRSGGRPSYWETLKFRAFSNICYAEGVAYGR